MEEEEYKSTRKQVMSDILTTVVESRFGDWFAFSDITRTERGDGNELSTLSVLSCRVSVLADPESIDVKSRIVSLFDVEEAVRLIANGGLKLNHRITDRFRALAWGGNEETFDFDAEDADIVLQAVMFGSYVYA